jgi:hypothetical protein
MKKWYIIGALLVSLQGLFSQDLIKTKKTSFGIQVSAQVISEYEQSWGGYYYPSWPVYYRGGIYIKHKRHSFEINAQNRLLGSKYILPSIGYNFKINKTDSKVDVRVGGELYAKQWRYDRKDDNVKCTIYTNYALAYGGSITKTYNRFSLNAGLYNYCTFTGYNRRFKEGLPKLQMLYGEEFSADMILEFKLQYRISK